MKTESSPLTRERQAAVASGARDRWFNPREYLPTTDRFLVAMLLGQDFKTNTKETKMSNSSYSTRAMFEFASFG